MSDRRLRDGQWKRRIARISRRMVAAGALCAVGLPCMVAELVQTLPHLWVSATALSLTLVTAAMKSKQ
jgi:hypothetical protein